MSEGPNLGLLHGVPFKERPPEWKAGWLAGLEEAAAYMDQSSDCLIIQADTIGWKKSTKDKVRERAEERRAEARMLREMKEHHPGWQTSDAPCTCDSCQYERVGRYRKPKKKKK